MPDDFDNDTQVTEPEDDGIVIEDIEEPTPEPDQDAITLSKAELMQLFQQQQQPQQQQHQQTYDPAEANKQIAELFEGGNYVDGISKLAYGAQNNVLQVKKYAAKVLKDQFAEFGIDEKPSMDDLLEIEEAYLSRGIQPDAAVTAVVMRKVAEENKKFRQAKSKAKKKAGNQTVINSSRGGGARQLDSSQEPAKVDHETMCGDFWDSNLDENTH